MQKPKFSIIIPTYNRCEEFLKPCISGIEKYTHTSKIEVIIVANGCSDGTQAYLDSLADVAWVKPLSYADPLGYPLANNLGITHAQGEYVILLNNDTVLQDQGRDYWLDLLEAPFKANPSVGITGPVKFNFDCGSRNYDCMAFWLVCIKKEVFDKIGGLDEAFSPGMGEDGDFCIRAHNAGYTMVSVPLNTNDEFGQPITNMGFPIHHVGNGTFNDESFRNKIVAKNRQLLVDRYGSAVAKPTRPKYSIVIPTYNHCDDLLMPCLESIERYSNMAEVEVVVVANGCTDNTRAYMEGKLVAPNYKMVWIDEPNGYTKSTNEGIKVATGEYIVLLNNDTEVLPSAKNEWLERLVQPFLEDPKVAITGPLQLHDNYADHDVLIFFCVMIPKRIFEELGILDEAYHPGGGEDIEFSVRCKQAGYTIKQIVSTEFNGVTNVGSYPIWHKDNKSFGELPEYTKVIVKRNGLLNCKRFNTNIKLNLGAGGIDYENFLSVDMNDHRAHVMMDITKLDFAPNTVSEIMASHVFEHLSPYDSVPTLKLWLGVLRPGGKLVMEMPDIIELCKKVIATNEANDMVAHNGALTAVYGAVNTTSVGKPSDITSPHLWGWSKLSLYYHMQEAGFTDIVFGPEQWPHPESNFRVEAYKPAAILDHASLQRMEPVTYEEIFRVNSYQVMRDEVRNKTIFDLGANLGMFTMRCLEWGAKEVFAIEAQPQVFEGLIGNVRKYGNVYPMNAAAFSDSNQIVKINNAHVASKLGEEGDSVKTVSLTDAVYLSQATSNDLVLKLDIEGSEFDVLLPTPTEVLRRFGVIYMEVHNKCNVNPALHDGQLIDNKLNGAGFAKVHRFALQGQREGVTFDLGIYVEKWVRQ